MAYKNIEDKRRNAKEYYAKNGKEREKAYFIKSPWMKTMRAIKARCLNKKHHYCKRGIKNFLNSKSIKHLWFRDKAYLMKQPSIDRLNGAGHYVVGNCRFIELVENLRRKQYVIG